jgi:DNA mismatch repair protein MutH
MSEFAPSDEAELLARCRRLEGLSVSQLAARLSCTVPAHPLQRKGWIGTLIERALGATAGFLPRPDFEALGIELKTLPINSVGKPAESTFVTSIPLLTIHQQRWTTSSCYLKLQRVLWFPVEASTDIPYIHRRFGRAFLWSPTLEQNAILESDWIALTTLVSTGQIAEVDARMGEYLQVRPKAANAQALCASFDDQGERVQTLPRGFYLRSRFTAQLFASISR